MLRPALKSFPSASTHDPALVVWCSYGTSNQVSICIVRGLISHESEREYKRDQATLNARQELSSGDRDFALLDWRVKANTVSLEKLAVPLYAKLRLAQNIKEYRFSLPGLLDYVYFQTTPMDSVVPGSELSFANCRKVSVKEIKRVPLNAPSAKALERARELLGSMVGHLKDSRKLAIGPPALLDRHYRSAGTPTDDNTGASGEVDAHLTFPDRR